MSSFGNISSKLRFVGFCGADDSIAPELLSMISSRYPWIEWGVLFRTDLEGTPRYASLPWVEQLAKFRMQPDNKMRLAAHFCFNRCQEILDGNPSFAQRVHNEFGFHRIQINATAANGVVVDHDNLEQVVKNIRHCMDSVPTVEFIFQLNDETKPIWNILSTNPPSNVSILHDASCGKGVSIVEFPSPSLFSVPCGYAGGIGPKTIENVLIAVSNTVPGDSTVTPVWIDMESSLRTLVAPSKDATVFDDIFDLNKCMQCVEVAKKFGL